MATQAGALLLLLRHVPLFAMLPESRLALLSGVVRRGNFARGATIIAAGKTEDHLCIIVSGAIKIVISDQDDGREVILSMLGPGEYFGEMAAIDGGTRSASAVSLDACELLLVPMSDFRKCLSENVELTMTVMRCLVRRLRDANAKIASLALMRVHGRVARLLLDLSETIDGQRVVTRRIARQDMARMIGASREMVRRAMNKLQVAGYIDVRGQWVYLHDNILTIH